MGSNTLRTLVVLILVLLALRAAEAQPAWRSYSTVCIQFGGDTTCTITKPAGVVSGDMLVAHFTALGSGVVTNPAGWSELTTYSCTNIWARIYTRTAGASEPANYTWTSASAGHWYGVMFAISGASARDGGAVGGGNGAAARWRGAAAGRDGAGPIRELTRCSTRR